MNRFLIQIILLLILSISATVIGELYIRYHHQNISPLFPMFQTLDFHPFYKVSEVPELVFELNPNVILEEELESKTPTNNFGFRDKNYVLPKPKNTFRIVGLGDSICYGLDIPSDKRYLKILEKQLNKNDRNKQYEVINCGIPGYNLNQNWQTYKHKASKYQSDLIIVSMALDDFAPPYAPAFVNQRGAHAWLIDNSALWKFLFFHFRIKAMYKKDIMKFGHQTNMQAAHNFIDLHNNKKCPVLFLFHPRLLSNSTEPEYDELKRLLSKQQIPWLDLKLVYEATLEQQPIESLALEEGDVSHPNIKGNQIIADALLKYLKETNHNE